MSEHRHFLLYKPAGYLSQFVNNQNRRRNKKLLGEFFDFPEGTMAIGRLDEKSEGLLMFTTNGAASALVRGGKVEKEYYAQLDGEITEEAILTLQNGVDISYDGKVYGTLPCSATKLHTAPDIPDSNLSTRDERHGPTSWISITLREGKFRQVRKMTAAVGFPTLRLVRVRIGKNTIEGMVLGEVLEVEQFSLE